MRPKLILWETIICMLIASCSNALPEMDLRPWPTQLKARQIADAVVSEKYQLKKPVQSVFYRKVMANADGTQTVIYHLKYAPHSRDFVVVVNPKTWRGRYLP